jgi:hypothetical protein
MMSAKKEKLRYSTGMVKDSNTIKTFESMDTLKPDDAVVIIHLDDYKKTFERMMKRISEMDEQVNEQSVYLNENLKEKKGVLGRFRKG